MKVQYKDEIIKINNPITIRKLLQNEIEGNGHVVVAAKFNNEYKNLEYEIKEDGKVELIDLSSKDGIKVYIRTLTFIVGKAFEKICRGKNEC